MAVSRREIEEIAVDPVPFGQYVLLDRIAEGRMGTVYRACSRDGRAEKLLAIKRVSMELSSDTGFAQRFNDVMSRAAQIEHSAHCAIEDLGRAPDGSLYVAMELVSGKDLGRIAAALHERAEAMPAPLVAYVGSRIAAALAAAHAMTHAGKPAPLYHGELAPADVLIGYDGSVCLTGLGSAALQAASPDPAPRYGYRAPELEERICTAQSDVFSLGACLSELLTGRSALSAETQGSVPTANRRPESHITRVVPRPFAQIVSRALERDAAARWESAAELAHALQDWCSAQPVRADRAALAAFMHTVFDATHKVEATRLQACLARLAATRPHPATTPSSQPAPEVRPNYPQLVRARESARSRVPVRDRAARLDQKNKPAVSAAPQRGTEHASWTDPAERTPARGMLMQKLAADMVGVERSQQRPPENALDNPWDDDSPAERWISQSEERGEVEWRIQARKPAAAQVPAPLAAPARAAVAHPPPVLPLSSDLTPPARGARLLVPALAGAALLAVIAAVALLRHAGSAANADHPQTNAVDAKALGQDGRLGTAPTQAVKSSPDPVSAGAPATDRDRQDQLARALQVKPNAESQTARALGDGDPDHGRARQRRASSEHKPVASELAVSEATTEAIGDEASPASTALDPAPRHESGSTPAEPASPVVSIRARPEAIAATAPSVAAAAASAAPKSVPAVSPAPRPPAETANRGVSRAAVLIERTTPRLSARARRIGITEGVALIELTIDRTGAVTNASVLKAEPQDIFEGASLKAIRQWRYQPALANGIPVESRQNVTIRFTE